MNAPLGAPLVVRVENYGPLRGGAMAEGNYDAFISYSHAADGLLAPRLQAGLQRFAKPWWRRRALRVFRDETGLSANPHLWDSIVAALAEADWFVLLASPDAASSEWVDREVQWWLDHKDPAHLLPVLTAGPLVWDPAAGRFDDTSAVPPALAAAYTDEPRWVDLRWAHDDEHLDLSNPRFREAVAELAAPIRGIAKDDLVSEEVHQHRRTIRTAWAAAGSLAVLAVASTVAGVFAFEQRDQARQEAATSRSLQLAAEVRLRDDDLHAALVAGVGSLDADTNLAALRTALVAQAATPSLVRTLPRVDGNRVLTPAGLLITPGDDLSVTDLATGATLDRIDVPVQHLVASPAGTLLAGVGADGIHLVQVDSGTSAPVPLGPEDLEVVAVSDDGIVAVLAGEDTEVLSAPNVAGTAVGGVRVRFVDAASGETLSELGPDEVGEAISVAFTPDGQRAVVVGEPSAVDPTGAVRTAPGLVSVVDVETGRVEVQSTAVSAQPPLPALSPDGSALAVADDSGVRFLSVPDLVPVDILRWPDPNAYTAGDPDGATVSWSSDGRRVLVGTGGGVVVWDRDQRRILRTLGRSPGAIGMAGDVAVTVDGVWHLAADHLTQTQAQLLDHANLADSGETIAVWRNLDGAGLVVERSGGEVLALDGEGAVIGALAGESMLAAVFVTEQGRVLRRYDADGTLLWETEIVARKEVEKAAEPDDPGGHGVARWVHRIQRVGPWLVIAGPFPGFPSAIPLQGGQTWWWAVAVDVETGDLAARWEGSGQAFALEGFEGERAVLATDGNDATTLHWLDPAQADTPSVETAIDGRVASLSNELDGRLLATTDPGDLLAIDASTGEVTPLATRVGHAGFERRSVLTPAGLLLPTMTGVAMVDPDSGAFLGHFYRSHGSQQVELDWDRGGEVTIGHRFPLRSTEPRWEAVVSLPVDADGWLERTCGLLDASATEPRGCQGYDPVPHAPLPVEVAADGAPVAALSPSGIDASTPMLPHSPDRPIAPGEYLAVDLEIPLSLTIDEGWTANTIGDDGNERTLVQLFHQPSGTMLDLILVDTVYPQHADEHAATVADPSNPGREPTMPAPDDVVGWLETIPDHTVEHRGTVDLGEVEGQRIWLTGPEEPRFPGLFPIGQFDYAITSTGEELVIAELDTHAFVISSWSPDPTLTPDDIAAVAQPVIETIEALGSD